DITWAVMDSGIDAKHPHFVAHENIDPASPLHADFTETTNAPRGRNAALIDRFGHGTHVAGIIAGEQVAGGTTKPARTMRAVSRSIKDYEEGRSPTVETHAVVLREIRGMAPRCRLVSLKVLDDTGEGEISNLIAAIAHIQEKNGHGRRHLIQGVNISLGYEFNPEWFACGQSPLCVEIDRLVRSGVVVVVAAGNTGYGALAAEQRTTSAGMQLTINDPGNADLAITVGSTHRDMPHVYGVSYFSSKGPTGDGRVKPDLVAPGERILSCATGEQAKDKGENLPCDYVEDSGTSMAAPHVSGVVAAFLSVRREFIGRQQAEDLYRELFKNFAAVAPDVLRHRKVAIIGVIWPSKRFTDVVDAAVAEQRGARGGGAGLTDNSAAAEATIRLKLDLIAEMFGKKAAGRIKVAKAQIGKLETDPAARDKFVDELRSLLDASEAHEEDNSKLFFKLKGSSVLERLKAPPALVPAAAKSGGGAASLRRRGVAVEPAGGAAGLGDIFSGFRSGAIRFLNYFTYYEMKRRAGTVGRNGVGPMLDRLADKVQRIHLVGHSFGGRVVTAAAAGSRNEKLHSMSLLQTAFSHNGFSRSMKGFFRDVVDRKRVKGPVLITHTPNDRAVGVAYPTASRLNRDASSGFGDANDKSRRTPASMKSFFAPNIETAGRAARAAIALALLLGAVLLRDEVPWLATTLLVAAAFTFFEAARGWCALRACGFKTRL
ncbi:MAG: S8 family peptidase, partial [Verrucomicrobiaceae bacterium]|nr:S8 family peptidase [Verrucomicrobiaceae bacterium]